MKSKTKRAFGIDICENALSFVELTKQDGSICLVNAQTASLADGIVKDGVVEDPEALANALKQLKMVGFLKHIDAALTVCAEPVLLQVINLPDSAPSEVKKLIQEEVRQYAVLPLKNVEIDYCGLKSSEAHQKRALVGAAQTEHLSMTAKAIEKDNVNIQTVEPAVTAFIRVCYNKVIKKAGEKNVMLLLIRDKTMTLCIFKKQRLEFIRTKKFETDIADPKQHNGRLGSEIESVIQFYGLEESVKSQQWEIVVSVCPDGNFNSKISQDIQSSLSRPDIEVKPFDYSLTDIAVQSDNAATISPVAAGAAMKLLGEDASQININLLPKEVIEIKQARTQLLIIANVAACLLILLFLYIAFLNRKSMSVGNEMYTYKQKQVNMHIQEMALSRKTVTDKLANVRDGLAEVQDALKDKNYRNWAVLLSQLVSATPQTILIQNMQGKGDDIVQIDGLAVNYESVNIFVDQLSKNELVGSATLADARQDAKYGSGLINYTITCFLK